MPECKNFSWPPKQEGDSKNTVFVPGAPVSPALYAPVQGLYSGTLSVTLTSATSGATLCYTTGALQPDCDAGTATCLNSTAYSVALNVPATVTIKSIACRVGDVNSAVMSATYTIHPPPAVPGFTTSPGDTQITLGWTNPADPYFAGVRVLRKTGSTPSSNTDGTVVFDGNGTAATDTGLANGTVYYYAAFAYDIAGNFAAAIAASATPLGGIVNAPVFSPVTGIFNAAQNISASTTTPGSIICYTASGGPPACNATPTCTTGTLYSGAVNIPVTTTLKAIACKNGSTDSGVTSGTYTIDSIPPVISGIQPAASTVVNSTLISYSLSETCASGSVTWTRSGGSPDSTVHVQPMTGTELVAGTYSAISLVNNPVLIDGTVYTIAFNCTDVAGNVAAPVSSTGVVFNSSPPGNVTGLRTIAGDTRVTLAWINPPDADLAGIKILRKTGSFPATNTDGTVIFNAIGTTVQDTGLANGTPYYYRAFAYDNGGNFASGATAVETPFSPCGGGACRIFVTTTAASGNIGGIAGADALCNSDSAKPNASVYKAILADSTARRACSNAGCSPATGVEQSLGWPLFPAKNYVRSDGVTAIATTTANALLLASLTNSIGTGGSPVWTGLNSDWTTSSSTCNNWTNAVVGLFGQTGARNSVSGASWSSGTGLCLTTNFLYCAEQ